MNKRFTLLSAISAIVLVFALVAIGVGIDPVTSPANQTSQPTVKPGSDFTFFGCWSYFPAGRFCRDIYVDGQGNSWICDLCKQTKNPSPKTCNPISQETLDRGYWCL